MPLALFCILYLSVLLILKMPKSLLGLFFCFQTIRWCSCFADKTTEASRPRWLRNFAKVIQLASGTMGILYQSAFPKVLESYFPTEEYFKM